jgi:hypothetical protein
MEKEKKLLEQKNKSKLNGVGRQLTAYSLKLMANIPRQGRVEHW